MVRRRAGLGRFFDNLTTIPPMLHYETVQRYLTHIPARFWTLREVCAGPDGTVFASFKPKNSLELDDYLNFATSWTFRCRKACLGSPARWNRWALQAWRRTRILRGQTGKGSHLATAGIGVVLCPAKFNDERFRTSATRGERVLEGALIRGGAVH